jgi:hypothetical protein
MSPFSFIRALILAGLVWWTKGAVFIPDNFSSKDLSAYTIRYLSVEGNDTDACLSSPIYTEDHQDIDLVHYCRTLIYALTGGHYFLNVSNLIVLILPGTYPMGRRGIEILNYRNIVLSKIPDVPGEVIIRCDEFIEEGFNNLFIKNASNIVLNEIVFTECGPHASPVNLQNTLNATISTCTFRYIHKY